MKFNFTKSLCFIHNCSSTGMRPLMGPAMGPPMGPPMGMRMGMGPPLMRRP